MLPDVTDVREISVQIAAAVIRQAENEGLAQETNIPQDDRELDEWIREQMWEARYRPLQKIDEHLAGALAKGTAGIAATGRRLLDH